MSYLATATRATFTRNPIGVQASPVFSAGQGPSEMLQLKNNIASALRSWFPALAFDVEYNSENRQYYFYIKDFDLYFTSEFDNFLNEVLSPLEDHQIYYFEFMPGTRPGYVAPEEVTLPEALSASSQLTFIGHTFTLDYERGQDGRDPSLDWMAA